MSITFQGCTVFTLSLLIATKPCPLHHSFLIFRLYRLKQSLRAGDLVLNSPFNGRSSKPDYLLARSIKRNVTYLHDSGKNKRKSLLCTSSLR